MIEVALGVVTNRARKPRGDNAFCSIVEGALNCRANRGQIVCYQTQPVLTRPRGGRNLTTAAVLRKVMVKRPMIDVALETI
jgi:hypothetical protein